VARALALFYVLCYAVAANAAEVVSVRPWELHSSFWVSLHQTLIEDAMRSTPRATTALSPEEQVVWSDAVNAYRTAGGRGDMTFARPMLITSDALTQVADDATEPIIDSPLKDALLKAAPVYRKHWWTADDQANRFFIGYATGMLREAGDRLVHEHETVYRAKWPARIRVYVTPFAGPFGAYTMNGLAGGVITTMSHRDEGYQGLHALEMLLHESSHAIVNPNNGTVASAIAAAAKRSGVGIPRDLWHAILFATSSELTRRLLAERGISAFVPSSVDLFSRAWPTYREPVAKFWLPYLSGEGTLEEAVDKVIAALPR
jgi:hypothetical protein